MKKKLVILNKSFDKDINRSWNLYKSVEKHNKDNIPFYLSVPEKDYKLFREKFPKNIVIFTDEEIWKLAKLDIKKIKKLLGWQQQQIIKLCFYKMNLSENYVTLDSDSYFFKDFYKSLFLSDDGIPFTIKNRKDNFDFKYAEKLWKEDGGMLDGKSVSLLESFVAIKESLGGNIQDNNWNCYVSTYGIWSSKALKSLEEKIKKDKNWNFYDIIKYSPYELQWYGQWIDLSGVIPLKYIGDIFCIINGEENYKNNLKRYINIEKDFKFKKYFGVSLQTRLKSGKIKYEVPKTFKFWIRNKLRNIRHIIKYYVFGKI